MHMDTLAYRQNTFGAETLILSFLMKGWCAANLRSEEAFDLSKLFENAHESFVF
jgi:hypothetical protein